MTRRSSRLYVPYDRPFRTVRVALGRTQTLRKATEPAGKLGFILLEGVDGRRIELPEARWHEAAASAA